MYLAIVLSTMLILPGLSWVGAALFFGAPWGLSPGLEAWFVFWAFGVRLFVAGVRQVAQPSFTAQHIFEIEDAKALVVVQELGFANIAFGILGLLSLALPDWRFPASIAGAVFYGLAGINHLFRKKNATEWLAMVSDLCAMVLFAVFTGFHLFALWGAH